MIMTYTIEAMKEQASDFIRKGGMFGFELGYIQNGETEYCYGDIMFIDDKYLQYSANCGYIDSFKREIDFEHSLDSNLEELLQDLTYKIIEAGFELAE